MEISIDEFISNIPNDELLVIEKINPTADLVFMPFVENPKLNAVKYTMKSKNIFVDQITKKKYFEFPRYTIDIITNIKCSNDTLLVINREQMKCDVSKVTLPIFNMVYTNSKLELFSDEDITYDVYLLSDNYREYLRKKRLINNENLMFFAGGCYYHNKNK